MAVEGHAITLTGLDNYLSNHHRDRLIVDATGLKGVYDFSVDYEIDIEKVDDRNVPFSEVGASLMDDLATALDPQNRIRTSAPCGSARHRSDLAT